MDNNQNKSKLKILSGLDPREYEHPFDRKALDSLQKIKGFDYLVRKDSTENIIIETIYYDNPIEVKIAALFASITIIAFLSSIKL